MLEPKKQLEKFGFVWCRRALNEELLADLESEVRFGAEPGSRPKATAKLVRLVGAGSELGELVRELLPFARPVRFVAFNKSSESNWAVPWHQDRVIAVKHRCETDGFAHWSSRGGFWHVEPPIGVLETMIFARLYFDKADMKNGAMQIAVGSHAHGRIAHAEAQAIAESREIEDCVADRGDVLFVKALALHRSASAQTITQRRVLRIDYSGSQLPEPLEWAIG